MMLEDFHGSESSATSAKLNHVDYKTGGLMQRVWKPGKSVAAGEACVSGGSGGNFGVVFFHISLNLALRWAALRACCV